MTHSGGVADERDLQRVQHEVARILAETEQPVEVYAATLEAVGRSLGWELGAAGSWAPATTGCGVSGRGTPARERPSSRRSA